MFFFIVKGLKKVFGLQKILRIFLSTKTLKDQGLFPIEVSDKACSLCPEFLLPAEGR